MHQEDKEQQYQEMVDAWLDGKMTASEVTAFEQKRREDPDLDAHCRFVLKMAGTLKQQQKVEFAAMIQGIEQELKQRHFFDSSPPKLSFWVRARPYMAHAATLLLLIGAIGFWQYNAQQREVERGKMQAAQAIAALPPLPKPAETQGFTSKSGEAFLLYAQGRYSDAADIWQKQYDDSPQGTDVRYYLGVCRLKNSENPAAIKLLQSLEEEVRAGKRIRPVDVQAMRWHLALALAADGQIKKAKSLLREIEHEHPDAKQFLEQL